MNKWFKTWNRPEYQEWATKTNYGYLLIILRQEQDKYLCAKAKLLLGEKGLPEVEIIAEQYHPHQEEAEQQIHMWKKESISHDF